MIEEVLLLDIFNTSRFHSHKHKKRFTYKEMIHLFWNVNCIAQQKIFTNKETNIKNWIGGKTGNTRSKKELTMACEREPISEQICILICVNVTKKLSNTTTDDFVDGTDELGWRMDEMRSLNMYFSHFVLSKDDKLLSVMLDFGRSNQF